MQEPDLIRSLRFQFHKGTIRTGPASGSPTPPPRFQFHKGTIRTMISSITNKRIISISIP